MELIKLLQSAAKGKAPVVAIPVEGKAPVCIDRKRLAAWLKGVTVTSVEVEPWLPYEEFTKAKGHVYYCNGEYTRPEGPEERKIHINGGRWLRITGTVPSKGYSPRSAFLIKTSCRMIAIDRRVAVKELSAWSSKERERLEKKTMMGALAKEDKKALKMAKHDTGSDRMIDVDCVMNGQPGKVAKRGLPVVIPELPRIKFALVMLSEGNWTVTEITSGLSGGHGSNPEAVLLDTRQRVKKLSPEKREEYQNKFAPPDEMEVAA